VLPILRHGRFSDRFTRGAQDAEPPGVFASLARVLLEIASEFERDSLVSLINDAANTIGNAILANLIVQEGSLAYFREGINDPKVPADVQALGAMYLDARNDGRAKQVGEHLRQRFFVGPRASTVGTLGGFRPFYGTGARDVIWSASLALDRVGVDHTAADDAVRAAVDDDRGRDGPVGADKDYADVNWGEYHTRPTSAAGSWVLIRSVSRQLLFVH
jgi:hypothetical protein